MAETIPDEEAKLFRLAIIHLMKTKLNAETPIVETRRCLDMDALLCGVVISRLEVFELISKLREEV